MVSPDRFGPRYRPLFDEKGGIAVRAQMVVIWPNGRTRIITRYPDYSDGRKKIGSEWMRIGAPELMRGQGIHLFGAGNNDGDDLVNHFPYIELHHDGSGLVVNLNDRGYGNLYMHSIAVEDITDPFTIEANEFVKVPSSMWTTPFRQNAIISFRIGGVGRRMPFASIFYTHSIDEPFVDIAINPLELSLLTSEGEKDKD